MVNPLPDNFIDRAVFAWLSVKDEDWKKWVLNADTGKYESSKTYFCKPRNTDKKFLFEVVRIVPKDVFEGYNPSDRLNYSSPIRLNQVGIELIDKSTHKVKFRVNHLGKYHEEFIEVIEYHRDVGDGIIIA